MTYRSLAVDIDIFDRAATGAAERSIEFLYRCARQCPARIDRETMRTSLTKVSAVAPVRPGGNAVTKMPCYAWIRGDCKLGDKCRFEHDPKSAAKSGGADGKGKGSKGKGKNGKVVQSVGRSVQKCFRYLRSKCEKGKDCGFSHLEVQRRMAEKKAKVLLAPVEESANAETEDWIWDTGAALDVASAAVAGKTEVSLAPPILSAGGVVNSVESVVVEMAEIGDTVKAAVLPNSPNALSAGRRCAQQGFPFVWRPWEAKPEIWAPDGTPIECTTDEHFVPVVRRTKKPLKVVRAVESVDAGSADTRPVGNHEGVAGNGVTVDDLASSVGFIEEAGDSADCREMLKDIDRVVHDDDDAGSAEAHDRVAGSAKFTLKKDGAEFEDEEFCTPYVGPQSVEHEALHLPRVRGCFACDHGKALHHYKRRSKGAILGLTGPDVALRPFGALVHIDWLEMKSGSKAHGIAARALLITEQETEFLGVLPSKRKLASEVICALHDFDDPGSPAIRRLISDRAPEFLSAGRTLRSSRPFAHFVTVPYRHASKAERPNRTAVECTRASLLQAGFVYDLLRGHVERTHARSRRVYSPPAQAWQRRTVLNVSLGIPGLRTSAQACH